MNGEQITAFLQEHWYIASVLIGAVILIGAVRNWNWLCDPTGTRDAHRHSRGYTNKIVDMFAADRTVSVELLCENKLMKTIIDHYGEAVPTRTYDEEHFTANIEVDPSGTFYGWVFKFMGGIQIIAPHECVEEMKRIAHRFL